MGYEDRYYFGQCRIISSTTITLKSRENPTETYSGTDFMVPGRKVYTTSTGATVYCGYGQTIKL